MEFPTHAEAEAEVARLREVLTAWDAAWIAARNRLAELVARAGDVRHRGDTKAGIEEALAILDTKIPGWHEEKTT